MCEFTNIVRKNMAKIRQTTVNEMFSEKVMFRFNKIIPSHCLICKDPLENYEMWPADRCSRSMCQKCYNHWVISKARSKHIAQCLTCGEKLPRKKVRSIQRNPREVKHHSHDHCQLPYAVMHSVIVGALDPKEIGSHSGQRLQHQPLPAPTNADVYDDDVIDVSPEVGQIEYAPQTTFNDMLSQMRQGGVNQETELVYVRRR